ncbi:IQ calmodulin binding motif-containing protein [Phytophthora infestans]|uniref:IQ calmodulin binding motif-containing protein n=1 Tax=Phytophthora infestans TaxID=4787 RepID=A0A833SVR9_PHYIN|nr:IQ calmodulin binding motif-containing protein [Phytophthora infestans]
MALRFGWEEVLANAVPAVNTRNASRSYYFNKNTLETSWERPDYSFNEQVAAIRIQALARMLLAINAFGLTKYVTSALGQSPLKELLATVSSEEKVKSLGWSKEEVSLVSYFPRILSRRFPRSCSRETSVPANVKHPFNILPSERVISQLVTQSYPNQQGRVAGLLRALRNSTTPISYRQLEMHLRRYAGRPDDAIANVGEVASLVTSTREPQEKAIFVLYLRCAERCVVYAANLKLKTLQRELLTVLRMPRRLLSFPVSSQSPVRDEEIIGTATSIAAMPVVPISPAEEEGWLQQAMSRYPSRAVKGLWENERSVCCVCVVGISLSKARARAATIIQCAWRALGAREERALLESQQQSPYEQRLEKRTNTFYFVYIPTDEKLLEEPRDESHRWNSAVSSHGAGSSYKRMDVGLATLHAGFSESPTTKPVPGAETPWVACSLCTAERAARRCNECYSATGDYGFLSRVLLRPAFPHCSSKFR